jgi:hypothetical protein
LPSMSFDPPLLLDNLFGSKRVKPITSTFFDVHLSIARNSPSNESNSVWGRHFLFLEVLAWKDELVPFPLKLRLA